jgi:hypothetical protein
MSKSTINEEKILTLNRDGKQGVNISKAKYDQVRNAILETMKSQETITMADLSKAVKKRWKANLMEKLVGILCR